MTAEIKNIIIAPGAYNTLAASHQVDKTETRDYCYSIIPLYSEGTSDSAALAVKELRIYSPSLFPSKPLPPGDTPQVVGSIELVGRMASTTGSDFFIAALCAKDKKHKELVVKIADDAMSVFVSAKPTEDDTCQNSTDSTDTQ